MRRVSGWILASALLAGCNNGGGNGNPSGPSAIVSIAVNSMSSDLPRGATETFTATATTAGGGTQQVTAGTWGSDAPGVVDITTGGQATGVGLGMATVFVDFEGVRGTKLIRVVSNFAGEYSGLYEVTACGASGDWIALAFCDDPFVVGAHLPLAFLFSQIGATLSGQTAIGSIVSGPLTATVREDGGVTVDAVANFSGVILTQTWELRADEVGAITGTLHAVVTEPSLSGNTTFDGTIISATRSSVSASGWGATPTDQGAGLDAWRSLLRQRYR
jgi:hypothetical protein